MRGVVLFAHGARDAEWALPFQEICRRIRSSRPEYPVELAFLESMSPTLPEAIASLAAEGAPAITVFPIFMAQGGHLKEDLPRLLEGIRAAHPHIPISLESAIGEVPEVLEAIAAWVVSRVE